MHRNAHYCRRRLIDHHSMTIIRTGLGPGVQTETRAGSRRNAVLSLKIARTQVSSKARNEPSCDSNDSTALFVVYRSSSVHQYQCNLSLKTSRSSVARIQRILQIVASRSDCKKDITFLQTDSS